MTTVDSGAGRAGHGDADCAVPKLRAGKGRGKGASKGARRDDANSRDSGCGDSSSTESTDESSSETSDASSVVAGWSRRMRQDDSDWSAFNDSSTETSSVA